MNHVGLSEPPEGALVGESVPRENEEDEVSQAAIEKLAGRLKAHPRFTGRSDAELEAEARRILRQED